VEGEPLDQSADLPPRMKLEALLQTDLMDSGKEESFDRLTRLVSQALSVPVVLMSLVDERRQFFKSAQGLPEPWATRRETPLSHSFCQHVVEADAPLAVEDARNHPLVAHNRAIKDLGVIAYLGIPIHDPYGHVLGSLCAIDTEVHAWTDADITLLTDYAALVEREIGLRAEIQRRWVAEEKASLVARELSHRIKNIFTVVSSLVSLSARGHPEAAQFAGTVGARIEALARAHDYVQPDRSRPVAEFAGHTLLGLISALMAPYSGGLESRVSISGADTPIGSQAVTTFALMLHELATNAVKYGGLSSPQGRIAITCRKENGMLILDWEERGGPIIDGPPVQQGFGTVLSQRAATRQLGARVVHDWDAEGLSVRMEIPLDKLVH